MLRLSLTACAALALGCATPSPVPAPAPGPWDQARALGEATDPQGSERCLIAEEIPSCQRVAEQLQRAGQNHAALYYWTIACRVPREPAPDDRTCAGLAEVHRQLGDESAARTALETGCTQRGTAHDCDLLSLSWAEHEPQNIRRAIRIAREHCSPRVPSDSCQLERDLRTKWFPDEQAALDAEASEPRESSKVDADFDKLLGPPRPWTPDSGGSKP